MQLQLNKRLLVCVAISSMILVLSACNESAADNGKALPDDFPSSVPIYEPSNVSTISSSTMAGPRYTVGFIAKGAEQDVVTFYDQALKENGWSITYDNGKGRFAAKNGSMRITVNVIGAGSGAVFTITTPKQ